MKDLWLCRMLAAVILLGMGISHQALSQQIQSIGKYLTIDYQPFFPIGLYTLPDKRTDDAMWKEVADAGFNFLLSEESGRHGIYVSKPIPWKEINGKKVSLMELYRDPGMLAELKSFLNEHESDPTMLCWHAPDEPGWFGPSANSLQLGYQAIKDHSKKPVWLNVGPSFPIVWHYSKPREMLATCDILSEDIYPVPDGQRKRGQGYNRHMYYVGEHTKMNVELASVDHVQTKPVWMILQGFGWGGWFENPKSFVPPTFDETRFMVYDAIVNGATGIIWYGPFTTETDIYAQLWKDIKSMASELRDLTPVLTCPFEIVPEKLELKTEGYAQENPVKWIIKLLEDKVYVIAVNTRPEPIGPVTFSLLDDAEASVTKVNVVRENREIPVKGNMSWTDHFEGYAVHIYETDLFYRFLRRYYDNPLGETSE